MLHTWSSDKAWTCDMMAVAAVVVVVVVLVIEDCGIRRWDVDRIDETAQGR